MGKRRFVTRLYPLVRIMSIFKIEFAQLIIRYPADVISNEQMDEILKLF